MKMYSVKQGTDGVLLTRYEDGNVTQAPFTTRQDLLFSDMQLQIDPIRIINRSYDPKSLGYQLAKKGYAIFIDNPGQYNQYALCVKYNDVEVM